MIKFILDTDMLQYFQSGVQQVVEQVGIHQIYGIGITIISFEEQLDDWNAELKKSQRISQSVSFPSITR